MERGYYKLWRCWFNDSVFKDPFLWKIFCWSWKKTNHKPEWILWKTGRGSTTVKVERGSFIFGRFSAAKELDMTASSVYKRIRKLQTLGKLSIKGNRHYSIITMANYEVFQPEKQDEVTGKVTGK